MTNGVGQTGQTGQGGQRGQPRQAGTRRAVVVTGASGMLGGYLCRAFAARGWEVRALVRQPDSFRDAVPGARVGLCDLPDRLDDSLLPGAAAVVHCAYATRATDLALARRVNEEGTRRTLEAARRAGVERFVFISTVAAHAGAPSYYARSKYLLEGLLDPDRDLVVRPGLILARHGQGLFRQMRELVRRVHVVPLFGGGRQPLQTVHVGDLCEAVLRAVELGVTGALNVAEPDPPALATFLRLLAKRLGVRCLYLPLPFAPVLAGLRAAEALRLPLPLRSESLLGLKGLRSVPVAEDLRRLDLTVRSARESLEDVA
jgi:nucleoside-diphosphate-sugar epimerase